MTIRGDDAFGGHVVQCILQQAAFANKHIYYLLRSISILDLLSVQNQARVLCNCNPPCLKARSMRSDFVIVLRHPHSVQWTMPGNCYCTPCLHAGMCLIAKACGGRPQHKGYLAVDHTMVGTNLISHREWTSSFVRCRATLAQSGNEDDTSSYQWIKDNLFVLVAGATTKRCDTC